MKSVIAAAMTTIPPTAPPAMAGTGREEPGALGTEVEETVGELSSVFDVDVWPVPVVTTGPTVLFVFVSRAGPYL